MTSPVEICNLALTHIGQKANLDSIGKPADSIEAEYCGKFYYQARDSLLEEHPWAFTLRRALLIKYTTTVKEWKYAYSVPADFMKALAIRDKDADADYTSVNRGYIPQEYVLERNENNAYVIYTNQDNAQLHYQTRVTNTNLYPALFVQALSFKIAALLAGSIIRGGSSIQISQNMEQQATYYVSKAAVSDSNQRRIRTEQSVPWIAARLT